MKLGERVPPILTLDVELYAGLQLAEVSTAGFQFPAELSKGPVGPRNQSLPLCQRKRHAEAD